MFTRNKEKSHELKFSKTVFHHLNKVSHYNPGWPQTPYSVLAFPILGLQECITMLSFKSIKKSKDISPALVCQIELNTVLFVCFICLNNPPHSGMFWNILAPVFLAAITCEANRIRLYAESPHLFPVLSEVGNVPFC